MFKTAATMIAHNSTIPALGGSQPLQDLITAEKAVLISLQKLSSDFSKASEALRAWGLSEGDDLGDILGASTAVINQFSAALAQYAAHGNGMREQLKAIRTREEDLDEMKRRRRAVFRKADDANKKLSKMSPEHKNLQVQTGVLNRLRDEVRSLDTDITIEEAALGDFKRTATKVFMGLKFGGLLECCQKGSIAATFGNMVVSEISEEQTKPGLHRAFYQGHPTTENFVTEANEAIKEVTLSIIPTLGFRDRRAYYNDRDPPFTVPNEKPIPAVPMDNPDFPQFVSPPFTSTNDVPLSPQRQGFGPWPETQGVGPPPFALERPSMDDFGMNLARSNTGPKNNTDAPGVRFATFPVQARPGANSHPPKYTLDLPIQTRHEMGPSFASSIADALDHPDNPDPFADSATASNIPSRPPRRPSTSITPSVSANPWADATEESSRAQMRKSNLSDNDDPLLAYLVSGEEEENDSTTQQPGRISEKNISQVREERLGAAPNAELRSSRPEADMSGSLPSGGPLVAEITAAREAGSSKVTITAKSETVPLSTSQLSSEEKERALNATAAREITVELEALNASSNRDRSPLQSDTVERGRTGAGTGRSYENAGRDSPPLDPPSAPFARRSISTNHYEVNHVSPSSGVGHRPPVLGAIPFPIPLSQQETSYSARSPPRHMHTSRPPPDNFPLSGSPPAERPSISMNNPFNIPGGMRPGARTIPAAAFKKPRHMSMDHMSMDNLQWLSKGLPVSPNPALGVGGDPRVFSPGIPPSSASYIPPSELEKRSLQHEHHYVDPYLEPDSPSEAEFGDTTSPPADGGYKTGNFATDLEGSTLRTRKKH